MTFRSNRLFALLLVGSIAAGCSTPKEDIYTNYQQGQKSNYSNFHSYPPNNTDPQHGTVPYNELLRRIKDQVRKSPPPHYDYPPDFPENADPQSILDWINKTRKIPPNQPQK